MTASHPQGTQSVHRDLAGTGALVTGASAGIGHAIARALARAGCHVALLARGGAGLDAAASEIAEMGGTGLAIPADLRDPAAIEAAVAYAEAELGGVGILVNAAGTTGARLEGPSTSTPVEDWDRQLDVMLRAVFLTSRAIAPKMIARGRGRIVNIASTFSFVVIPEYAAYCASKGGVIQLTKALAVEWARHGLTVNAVAPGAVRTESNEYFLDDPANLAFVLSGIPAGRLITVDDVAAAVTFLCGPGADMITGQCLIVDGGYTIR